jgi:hypothetical protein
MIRCLPFRFASVSIAFCALLVTSMAVFPSQAWAARTFPPKVQRAEMTFVAVPDVLIDGQPVRMDHSVRIHSERNTLVRPGGLNGRTAIVNYLREGRDAQGKVREVWILSAEEIAVPPPNAQNTAKTNIVIIPPEGSASAPITVKPGVVLLPAPTSN